MTLTVPRAGVIAGQSATPRIEAPDTGSLVAEFGQRVAQIGQAMEGERLDREMGRARISMMEGLNGLRLDMEALGDPDRIDAEFGSRKAALRDTILGGLDAKNREDAALMFDELSSGHQMALGRQALDLRVSQRRAIAMQTQQAAVNTAAASDPETASSYLGQYRASLDAEVAAGTRTPEEAETVWQETLASVGTARMERMLREDPETLIGAVQAGELGQDLTPEDRERWITRGTALVAGNRERENTEAKRVRTAQVTAAKDVLKDGIAVIQKGQPFAGSAEVDRLLQDPEIAATDEARQYRFATALADAKPGFQALGLDDKKAALRDYRAQPKAKGYEADVVAAMEASVAEHEKAIREDIYGYLPNIGLEPVAALPAPDATDADLGAALKQRSVERSALRDAGITGDQAPPFFSPTEKAAWSAAAAPGADPRERLRIAEALTALGPADAQRAAAEISQDGVFVHVGGLVANAGPEAKTTALQVFEGQVALAAGDSKLPSETEFNTYFNESFGDQFDDGTQPAGAYEDAARRTLLKAVRAQYAYLARGNAELAGAEIDPEVMNQAIHAVTGGIGTYGGRDAKGGLQEVRGRAIFMPPGFGAAQVEDQLDAIADDIDGGSMTPEDWQRLSPDGQVPTIGGRPIDARTWGRLTLDPRRGTVFGLVYIDRDGTRTSVKGEGQAGDYTIDIGRLGSAQDQRRDAAAQRRAEAEAAEAEAEAEARRQKQESEARLAEREARIIEARRQNDPEFRAQDDARIEKERAAADAEADRKTRQGEVQAIMNELGVLAPEAREILRQRRRDAAGGGDR